MRKGKKSKLNEFVGGITDPRQMQGKRHRLSVVVKIAIAARAAGQKGYVGMSEWANALPQAALRELGARKNAAGRYYPPSESTIRRVLQKLDSAELHRGNNDYFLVMNAASPPSQ